MATHESSGSIRAPIVLTKNALMPIGLVIILVAALANLGMSWHLAVAARVEKENLANIERVRLEMTRQEEVKSLRRDLEAATVQLREVRIKVEYANRRLDTAGIKEK